MAVRRKPQTSGCELTDRRRAWLLTGVDWTFLETDAGPEGSGGFPNLLAARKAWEECRDELIAYWTQRPETWTGTESLATPEPAGPGHRPWGWWRFDAEVPRRLTEHLDADRKAHLRALGWFTEAAWRDFFGSPVGDQAEVESESAYLQRHGLDLPLDDPPPPGPRPAA